jgi:hypothetical protein
MQLWCCCVFLSSGCVRYAVVFSVPCIVRHRRTVRCLYDVCMPYVYVCRCVCVHRLYLYVYVCLCMYVIWRAVWQHVAYA